MKQQVFNQWLSINEQQLLANVARLQRLLGTEIAAVVKGNGYGHGMQEATSLFYKAGIRNFCTYHAHAALQMKKQFPDCRWIAMGPVRQGELKDYFEHGVELFVWDADFIDLLNQEAQKTSQIARIHLELETGMYRTGLNIEETLDKLSKWQLSEHIKIAGVCTHFSGADEQDNLQRIDRQFERWQFARKKLAPLLDPSVIWHGESSSASVYLAKRAFTMARVGLLLYGFFPSPLSRDMWPDPSSRPRPAIQLCAKVTGTNHLPKGGYTGYGASYQAQEATDTIILPLGYADGLPRQLSNRWSVKINDHLLPIIGRVNMNMVVIDAKGTQWEKEEKVIAIDQEGPNGWYAAGKSSGRFIYELLTCLPLTLPRLIQ